MITNTEARRESVREDLLKLVGGAERFTSSFSQRTHSPERHAQSALTEGVDSIIEGEDFLRAKGADDATVDDWKAGYLKKWSAYQAAGARTANWMITGPANFPVERNRKRLETEHKRMGELIDYRHGIEGWLQRRQARAERAELVASDQGGHKETAVAGIRIVENETLDRIQIIFPDKPSDEERAALKGRGFRWAPSTGSWQRKLTNNARHVAKALVERFTAEGAAG